MENELFPYSIDEIPTFLDKKQRDKDWQKEYENFKVIRPIPSNFKTDEFDMPIVHRLLKDEIDIENAIPTNIHNLSYCKDNHGKIVFSFRYDNDLIKYWGNPLKYITLLQTTMAVCTPDFSIYPDMNKNEIRHNIYMNRWLGCLWQSYCINVIPTVSWANSDTYDLCFAGFEEGGIVAISTLGCQKNANIFLEGLRVLQNKKHPSVIIVYGNMIQGMKGDFMNYRYRTCFNDAKSNDLSLFDYHSIFNIA